jgi:hypothetical protein
MIFEELQTKTQIDGILELLRKMMHTWHQQVFSQLNNMAYTIIIIARLDHVHVLWAHV